MARSAKDLALLLPIIAGPDWIDPAVAPMSLRDPNAVVLGKLRVAFHTDNGILSPPAETLAVVEAAAGADGIYIWNQDWIKSTKDDRFDPQSWKEIGDPTVLAKLDKHYVVGPHGRGGNLPMEVASAGDAARIPIDISDDLTGALERPEATLSIRSVEVLIRYGS